MKFPNKYFSIFLIFSISTIGLLLFFFQKTSPQTVFTNFAISNTSTNLTIFTTSTNSVIHTTSTNSTNNPLANPPEIIKAVYFTGWSAGSKSRIDYLINFASSTEINAVVIDVKDYSGYILYDTAVSEVKKYKAEKIKIPDIDFLIKKLHNKGIYVIARITVFQDPILARARPDLAVHSKSKLLLKSSTTTLPLSFLWLDNRGLAWIDPAAREAWDYNIAIAKDATSRGFDEINFDYIRFPSDGNLKDMRFPFWSGKTPKYVVIKEFFKYIRQELPDVKISVDLFGLSATRADDLGIGQIIENAFEYFDFVSPMVYPSHYSSGFLGYKNPAEYPYEVVNYSMKIAQIRLSAYKKFQKNNAKLRPWIQDFSLETDYTVEMVKSEIKATRDATGNNFAGFMLWNPSNFYTKEAFKNAEKVHEKFQVK